MKQFDTKRMHIHILSMGYNVIAAVGPPLVIGVFFWLVWVDK